MSRNLGRSKLKKQIPLN